MGLFGRKKTRIIGQIEILRAEIVALRERLDMTEAAKLRLEENVSALYAENGTLRDELLEQITTATSATNDSTRILAEQTTATLHKQLADLAVVATDAAERAAGAVGQAERADDRIAASEALATAAFERADAADKRSVAIRQETANTSGRLNSVVNRIGALDARVTQVATELANQVTELGKDLNFLSTAGQRDISKGDQEAIPFDEELIGELREAQERLAIEQARYQIAFRQDLADLADRLRRHR